MLTARNTFGCTMPAPMISIQPLCPHNEQPDPPHEKHVTSTSTLGSVNGKKCGLKRTLVSAPNNSRKNMSTSPRRSAIETSVSMYRPSTWWNSAWCDASMASLRYTRPGA